MANGATQFIQVPRDEYARLQKLDKKIERMMLYFQNVKDAEEARADITAGRTYTLEEVEARLGLKF